LPKCEACRLYRSCRSPKMPVDGEGRLGVLVVGEAPGEREDEQNRPFVGPAGALLKESLRKIGVDLRRDCWATNSLICRPPGNEIENPKAVEYCRPNVVRAIEELRPEKVILLGARAVESVIGWLWKPSPGGIMRWAGFRCSDRKINAWVCPTFHPSAVLRQRDPRVMRLMFDRHLEDAFVLEGRPYAEVSDPAAKIKLIYKPQEACDRIHRVIDSKRACAFDYETTHASPYSEGSAILCCAISDGAETFAFPWSPPVEGAMRQFLTGPNRKLAHNMAFEHAWSAEKLDVEVEHWHWDAMISQHALDNRKDICGLKFLSYAVLGYRSYDDHVDPLKRGDGPHSRNRLHELPVQELLKYCGLDALFNYELAREQCRLMKIKL
jgi:uracil-DNA glycosylase family 4